MSINFKGTNVTDIVYQGTVIDNVYYNGTLVYTRQTVVEQNNSRSIERGGWYNLGANIAINGFDFTPYIGRTLTLTYTASASLSCGFVTKPQGAGASGSDFQSITTMPTSGTLSWVIPASYPYFRIFNANQYAVPITINAIIH